MVMAENSGLHYTSEASFRLTVSTMLPNGSLFGDTPGHRVLMFRLRLLAEGFHYFEGLLNGLGNLLILGYHLVTLGLFGGYNVLPNCRVPQSTLEEFPVPVPELQQHQLHQYGMEQDSM